MTMSNNDINNKNSDGNLLITKGIPSNAISIVKSVADEECALSALIQAEANILYSITYSCLTASEYVIVTQSIIRSLKTILNKNNILEVKLRETLNFIKKEGIQCLDYNNQYELLNNLNSILKSIASEEYSLGCLIDALGEGLINVKFHCSFDEIKQVNNIIITLMKVIIEKNMILLRKLKTAINIIEFIKCSDLDIFIQIKKNLLCTIKELIKSIFNEEKGLAKLIYGESVKIRKALKMCLSDEELNVLDCLLTDIIDIICEKKKILENKLVETIKLLKIVSFSPCDIETIIDYISHIQSHTFTEEFELATLISDEYTKLNIISDNEKIYKSVYFKNCIPCILAELLLNLNIGRENKNSCESNSVICNDNKCNKKKICKKFNNLIKTFE